MDQRPWARATSKSCCCLRVQVYVELRGDGGSSGRVVFRDVQPSSFERGAVDSLTLHCRALGEVRQLVVGHDCSGDRRRWHLDTAEVRLAPADRDSHRMSPLQHCPASRFGIVQRASSAPGWPLHTGTLHPALPRTSCSQAQQLSSGRTWYFECGQWLEALGARRAEAALPALAQPPQRGLARYQVRVHTSDVRGAGTDAGVHLVLVGADGAASERLPLEAPGRDLFQRATVDEFQVAAPPVGAIACIRIGHDNRWVCWQPRRVCWVAILGRAAAGCWCELPRRPLPQGALALLAPVARGAQAAAGRPTAALPLQPVAGQGPR